MMTDDTTDRAAVTLPAVLDLAAAVALHEELCAALQASGVSIDAALVERVATPCLQLLCAARATAAARALEFRLLQPSEVLAAAITDLGLAAALGVES